MNNYKEIKMELEKMLDIEGYKNLQVVQMAKELEVRQYNNEMAMNKDLMEIFEFLALIESETNLEEKVMVALYQAMEQKKQAFDNFAIRKQYFTDDTSIDRLDAEIYNNGIYLKLDGCRCGLNVFVDRLGNVIRKPRKAILLKKQGVYFRSITL